MPSELGSSIGRFGLIAAGGYAFGPVFAAAGAVLGSFLFGASGPEIEGPRLGDTSVSASTYGNVIPVAFGVQKLAGSMIWATDIIEDENTRTEGDGTIRSSVAIVNDTTWSTIVGTWRPGRLELYVDGWSRASSTAAATSTSALFGIYRWGWGFSTSQDFNGDVALTACFASSWTPAMVRRWHADPFAFLRPGNEVPALLGSAPPATPLDRHRRGHLPDGVASNGLLSEQAVACGWGGRTDAIFSDRGCAEVLAQVQLRPRARRHMARTEAAVACLGWLRRHRQCRHNSCEHHHFAHLGAP